MIAVISWMAGMLYLPRLFVYHCEAEIGSKQSETFKMMERRLLKAIINPAMIVTWLAGLYLAWSGHLYSAGWFHAKLAAGAGDVGCPRIFWPLRARISPPTGTPRSQKFYRIINEVPTLLMIGDRDLGDRQAVLTTVVVDSCWLLDLLAEGRPIFYIARNPTPRRRMWLRSGFFIEPAAASGLKPLRRFPCSA